MKEGLEHNQDSVIERLPQLATKKYSFETGTAEEGFAIFKKFVQELRDKNPDLSYPSDSVIDRIGPNKLERLVAYITNEKDEAVGAIIGNAEPGHFDGLWFIIDPEHQQTEVGKELIESVATDFDEVKLLANVADVPREADSERKGKRQEALIRYYRRLGMEPDTESESFKYSKLPGGPMPMVWRKNPK